jgi:hypothetical protein
MAANSHRSSSGAIRVTAVIERKQAQLPRFVVVPSKAIASWDLDSTTFVEGKLNDVDLGRRTIKRWDDQRWFIELPQPLCRKAHLDTGDPVVLVLQIASDRLPVELARLLAKDPIAKAVWDRLTPSAQRILREEVAAAKQPATRERRAARALRWRRD